MKLSPQESEDYLESILGIVRETLVVKAKEYVRNEDMMHNFNVGSNLRNCPREKIIDAFRLKHEISRQDIVNDIEKGILPDRKKVLEKYIDIINYDILELISVLHRVDKDLLEKSKNPKHIIKETYDIPAADPAYSIPLFLPSGAFWKRLIVSKEFHDVYIKESEKK